MYKHDFDEVIDRRGTECKKYSKDYFAEDVLPMWIADTDFKCPQPIIDAFIERTMHGILGYPQPKNDFKEAVAGWYKKRFDTNVDINWVDYVPGVIGGVVCAIRACTLPGDKVIIQTPCYPPFREQVELNGRFVVENTLRYHDGRYDIDFELLEKQARDKRVTCMIICNPQNPSGRCFTREELEKIVDICLRNDVFMICDEIHCDLVYKGHKHVPLLSLSEEAKNNCVCFINPSKTFNIAGLRVSAMICPNKELHRKIYSVLAANKGYGHTIYGTLGLITAYNECEYYVDQMMEYLEENLSYLRESMKDMPKIKMVEPEATYLIWLDCEGLGLSQPELVAFFKEKAKLGLNVGAEFGKEGTNFMRLNIAVPRTTLVEGVARLKKAYYENVK